MAVTKITEADSPLFSTPRNPYAVGYHTGAVGITIDIDEAFKKIGRFIDRGALQSQRAITRTLRIMETWVLRRALRAASQGSGIPAKYYTRAFRAYSDMTDTGIAIWIGTNEIPVHRLGNVEVTDIKTRKKQRIANVIWKRSMKGAQIGKRKYPGAWSWGRGKTGPAVMRRSASDRLPIERVEEKPHEAVLAAMHKAQDDIGSMFNRRLAEQLNYAWNIESR
jgi:hypothetical protein